MAMAALTSEAEHYRAQMKEAQRLSEKMVDAWPLLPLMEKYNEAVILREEARTVLGEILAAGAE
ncbi:MAG TPA: hypothetical protein VIA06_05765 [Candidatus Dormibacteraeota bacterium]|nr:hypothetical protein [Candidatus Dormibacteraeota bacterium]